MDIEVEEKGPFKVIGIVECGRAEDGNDWVPTLWSTVFERMEEIAHLIKADKTFEAWGLMSGIESYLGPWKDKGRYLAGFEIEGDIEAPEGWTIWEVPEQKYSVVGCTMDGYMDVYEYVMDEFLPEHDYESAGAFHEFYPEEFEDIEKDTLYLYIPIEKKIKK